jgi:hydrogenase 3 maturation protease
VPEPVLVFNAGTAPENFTGVLRRFDPDLVLIIDAVEMNAPSGTIRLLDLRDIENCSMTTHTLSHHLFAYYLETELKCNVRLLGIQLGQNSIGGEFSPQVNQSIRGIVRVLQSLCQNCQG